MPLPKIDPKQHVPDTLGGRLKFLRDGLYLRQTEMAQYLGISISLYTKLESDRQGTSIRTLARFAEKLNTTVEFLKDGIGNAQCHISNHPSDKPINIKTLEDDLLQRIVEYAIDPTYQKLADNIVTTLHLTRVRALSMIIRTMLNDPHTANDAKQNQQEPPLPQQSPADSQN